MIPFTWQNVTEGNNTLLIEPKDAKKDKTITISSAYYTSVPALVMALKEALKKAFVADVKISADTQTMRMTIDRQRGLVEATRMAKKMP